MKIPQGGQVTSNCLKCGRPHASIPVDTENGRRHVHRSCYDGYMKDLLRSLEKLKEAK